MKRSIKRASFLSATAAAALLPSAVRAQASLTALRIAGTPDEDMVGSFWAQQSGIFQKYGIDADVRTISSGAAITAAVVGGSLEIGRASLLNLILAHARGIPLLMVAASLMWNSAQPASALIVAKDATIRTGRDLNGTTVAVSALNDFYALMDSAWIDAHGGDSSSVHFVEIPAAPPRTRSRPAASRRRRWRDPCSIRCCRPGTTASSTIRSTR